MASSGIAPGAEAAVGLWVERLARWLALFGGLVLAGLALMTVASIIGRAFIFAGLSPVRGDYELVQMGCAIAVFSFLPWCQLNRGHVTVDVIVDRFPARARAFLTLLGDVALFAAAVLIAWRLWLGVNDKRSYGEETYELGLQLWWGYGAAMVGAALFAVVAGYTAWRSLNEMLRGGDGGHPPVRPIA